MKNLEKNLDYTEEIKKLFNNYPYIKDSSFDDEFFLKKYGRYGIKTRKEWFIAKVNLDIFDIIYNDIEYVTNLFKEKGATYINANIKNVSPRGSTGSDSSGSSGSSKKYKQWDRYNVEDLYTFDYKAWLNSTRNKYDKIYNIEFNHTFYDDEGIKFYKRFKEMYYEWKSNGNLDIFNEFVEKLDKYLITNKLKASTDYFDSSIMCNIGLIISKYIKTGILENNIDFINNMSIEEMNEETNMFCLFLLFQLFTAKQYSYVQYIRGCRRPKYKIIEETNKRIEIPWKIIHNIRRRTTNKDYKSKGVIPKFIKNEDGTYSFILY